MEKQDHTKESPAVHHIWIGEQERIASFHKVDTYKLRIVRGDEDYVKYLEALLEQGFRFQ